MIAVRCELNVLRSSNLGPDKHLSGLFVRCHIPVGGGKRIRVDSREITSCDAGRSPLAVLECRGSAEDNPVQQLRSRDDVVFELRRRRKAAPFFGTKLLGSVSVAWKHVMGAAADRRIAVDEKNGWTEGSTTPAVLIEMRTRVSETAEKAFPGRDARAGKPEECRCRHCQWDLEEEDMFALAAMAC